MKMKNYRYEWWRLGFNHVYVDFEHKLFLGRSYSDRHAETGLRMDVALWLNNMRRLGSLGVEPAYEVIPPHVTFEGDIDGPRPYTHAGKIRFARKKDLVMFRLSI